MKQGKCRSCNADIFWIELNDKPHPIDIKPEKRIVFIPERLNFGEIKDTYISHFATCPQADKWRNKKK